MKDITCYFGRLPSAAASTTNDKSNVEDGVSLQHESSSSDNKESCAVLIEIDNDEQLQSEKTTVTPTIDPLNKDEKLDSGKRGVASEKPSTSSSSSGRRKREPHRRKAERKRKDFGHCESDDDRHEVSSSGEFQSPEMKMPRKRGRPKKTLVKKDCADVEVLSAASTSKRKAIVVKKDKMAGSSRRVSQVVENTTEVEVIDISETRKCESTIVAVSCESPVKNDQRLELNGAGLNAKCSQPLKSPQKRSPLKETRRSPAKSSEVVRSPRRVNKSPLRTSRSSPLKKVSASSPSRKTQMSPSKSTNSPLKEIGSPSKLIQISPSKEVRVELFSPSADTGERKCAFSVLLAARKPRKSLVPDDEEDKSSAQGGDQKQKKAATPKAGRKRLTSQTVPVVVTIDGENDETKCTPEIATASIEIEEKSRKENVEDEHIPTVKVQPVELEQSKLKVVEIVSLEINDVEDQCETQSNLSKDESEVDVHAESDPAVVDNNVDEVDSVIIMKVSVKRQSEKLSQMRLPFGSKQTTLDENKSGDKGEGVGAKKSAKRKLRSPVTSVKSKAGRKRLTSQTAPVIVTIDGENGESKCTPEIATASIEIEERPRNGEVGQSELEVVETVSQQVDDCENQRETKSNPSKDEAEVSVHAESDPAGISMNSTVKEVNSTVSTKVIVKRQSEKFSQSRLPFGSKQTTLDDSKSDDKGEVFGAKRSTKRKLASPVTSVKSNEENETGTSKARSPLKQRRKLSRTLKRTKANASTSPPQLRKSTPRKASLGKTSQSPNSSSEKRSEKQTPIRRRVKRDSVDEMIEKNVIDVEVVESEKISEKQTPSRRQKKDAVDEISDENVIDADVKSDKIAEKQTPSRRQKKVLMSQESAVDAEVTKGENGSTPSSRTRSSSRRQCVRVVSYVEESSNSRFSPGNSPVKTPVKPSGTSGGDNKGDEDESSSLLAALRKQLSSKLVSPVSATATDDVRSIARDRTPRKLREKRLTTSENNCKEATKNEDEKQSAGTSEKRVNKTEKESDDDGISVVEIKKKVAPIFLKRKSTADAETKESKAEKSEWERVLSEKEKEQLAARNSFLQSGLPDAAVRLKEIVESCYYDSVCSAPFPATGLSHIQQQHDDYSQQQQADSLPCAFTFKDTLSPYLTTATESGKFVGFSCIETGISGCIQSPSEHNILPSDEHFHILESIEIETTLQQLELANGGLLSTRKIFEAIQSRTSRGGSRVTTSRMTSVESGYSSEYSSPMSLTPTTNSVESSPRIVVNELLSTTVQLSSNDETKQANTEQQNQPLLQLDVEQQKQQLGSLLASAADGDQWSSSFSPVCASDVIGNQVAVAKLRKWLLDWKEKCIENEAKEMSNEKRKKRRVGAKRRRRHSSSSSSSSGSEFVTDDDLSRGSLWANEDEAACTSAMLITGPTAAGKSCVVYALASELGYEVFEVNASDRRSGKTILTQLQEATLSHQVQLATTVSGGGAGGDEAAVVRNDDKKQQNDKTADESSKGNHRFRLSSASAKQRETKTTNDKKCSSSGDKKKTTVAAKTKEKKETTDTKQTPPAKKKICLILFEDIDVQFDGHDESLVNAICTVITSARRPVLVTSNLSPHKVQHLLPNGWFNSLAFIRPIADTTATIAGSLASRHLQLMCLAKGVHVPLPSINRWLLSLNGDLRKALLQLHFAFEHRQFTNNTTRERNIARNELNNILITTSSQFHSSTEIIEETSSFDLSHVCSLKRLCSEKTSSELQCSDKEEQWNKLNEITTIVRFLIDHEKAMAAADAMRKKSRRCGGRMTFAFLDDSDVGDSSSPEKKKKKKQVQEKNGNAAAASDNAVTPDAAPISDELPVSDVTPTSDALPSCATESVSVVESILISVTHPPPHELPNPDATPVQIDVSNPDDIPSANISPVITAATTSDPIQITDDSSPSENACGTPSDTISPSLESVALGCNVISAAAAESQLTSSPPPGTEFTSVSDAAVPLLKSATIKAEPVKRTISNNIQHQKFSPLLEYVDSRSLLDILQICTLERNSSHQSVCGSLSDGLSDDLPHETVNSSPALLRDILRYSNELLSQRTAASTADNCSEGLQANEETHAGEKPLLESAIEVETETPPKQSGDGETHTGEKLFDMAVVNETDAAYSNRAATTRSVSVKEKQREKIDYLREVSRVNGVVAKQLLLFGRCVDSVDDQTTNAEAQQQQPFEKLDSASAVDLLPAVRSICRVKIEQQKQQLNSCNDGDNNPSSKRRRATSSAYSSSPRIDSWQRQPLFVNGEKQTITHRQQAVLATSLV